MISKKVRLLTSVKERIGEHNATYRLSELHEYRSRFYLASVRYNGEHGLCALNCRKKREAEKIFCMLVRTHTTPLSLSDTVYDLYR